MHFNTSRSDPLSWGIPVPLEREIQNILSLRKIELFRF